MSPKARFETAHPYLVMSGLFLGTFTGMFSETSLNIALPQLMKEFCISSSLAQWMVVGYMLVIGIILPLTSLLMKWFSARKLTNFAILAFLAGSVISGTAPSYALLLTGRMIQGIGTGIILPMTFAVAMEVFPPNKIGKAMGITALIIMFAPVIGPTYSGIIIGISSWRLVFFTFAALLLISLILSTAFLVNPYTLTKPKIDLLSCVLSVVGFAGVVYGTSVSSMYGWISAPVLTTLIIGIISLVIYSKRQLSMAKPILSLLTFKTGGFSKGTILVMINFGITLASMYILPQYLQNGRGLDVSTAGILMLPGGIVNALTSFIAGGLYDKYGAKLTVKIGFLCSIAGAVLFLFVSTTTPVAYIILCHVILMIGVPLAMSPSQTDALNSLPKHITADGSTILNTLQQVMGAISTAISTSLLEWGIHSSSSSTSSFVNGSRNVFAFTVVLSFLGFLISLKKIKEKTE